VDLGCLLSIDSTIHSFSKSRFWDTEIYLESFVNDSTSEYSYRKLLVEEASAEATSKRVHWQSSLDRERARNRI